MYSGTRRQAVVSDRGKAFVTATDQALGLHGKSAICSSSAWLCLAGAARPRRGRHIYSIMHRILSTLTCRQSHTVSAEGCQSLTGQREHDPKRKTREHDPKRKARERDPTRKAQELDPKRKTREHDSERMARERDLLRRATGSGCHRHLRLVRSWTCSGRA